MIKNIKGILENFFKYYDLIIEMVSRDIKIKYKKSILGFAWSILNPLLMMLVMTVVFSTLFKSDIPNFPMYLLTGQVLFGFFSESTNMSMTSILGNAGLIKKVYIPKYIFPLSKVMFGFTNMLFSLVAVLIVGLITKTKFSISILIFTLPLIYIFIFALVIGLILAVYAIFFRDLLHLYGILILIWTYLTPIFYPVSILPNYLQKTVIFNPMYVFINNFREIVLYGKIPTLHSNILCLFYAFLSIGIGIVVFYKNQDKFIFYI